MFPCRPCSLRFLSFGLRLGFAPPLPEAVGPFLLRFAGGTGGGRLGIALLAKFEEPTPPSGAEFRSPPLRGGRLVVATPVAFLSRVGNRGRPAAGSRFGPIDRGRLGT